MFRENRHNKDGQHAQAVPKNFDFGDSNVLVDVLAGTSHGDGLWSSDRLVQGQTRTTLIHKNGAPAIAGAFSF
jgi:hypothetical protein